VERPEKTIALPPVERAASAVRRMKIRSAAFSSLPQVLYVSSLPRRRGVAGEPRRGLLRFGWVCVFEAQVDWFSRELDKLASLYSKNPEDVEFHASTIFSRREASWKALTVEEARGLLKSVLHVAASSYETTRLFAYAIHEKSLPRLRSR